MKKTLLIILLVVTGLIPIIVKGTSLSFTKGVINESGTLLDGVSYESFSAETTTDYGTVGKQNISYVKALSTSKTKIVTWAKTLTNKITGGNLVSIAEDYEKNNPEYEVLAAINGDYYDMTTFTPVNAHVQNNIAIKSENFYLDRYFSVGFTNDENLFVINKKNVVEPYYSLAILENDKVIKEIEIQGFNQIPQTGETSIYYNLINTPEIADTDIFSIKLDKALSYGNYYLSGIVENEVDSIIANEEYFSLATKSDEIASYLLNGYKIRVQKYMSGVYNNIESVIGVGSQPLENGVIKNFDEINDQSVSFAENRHPRSSFGFTNAGDFVLLTIDGRQTDMSGANLREVSKVMKSLDVENAFNLDGGGSTQLVIKKDGELVYLNSPSEDRRVANAVLIVAPKAIVECEVLNINYNSFDFNYTVNDGLGEVIDHRVYLDGTLLTMDNGSISLTALEMGEIYTVSIEVDYMINENVYTNIFVNKRVNLKLYEDDYVKQAPSNFSLQIEKNDSINGFDVFVNYDDPDKTLTKMYLIFDDEKEIVAKSIGGYLYQMYNAEKGRNYGFKIEYYYRIDTINPVFETTQGTFYYKYENIEEPLITTENIPTVETTRLPEEDTDNNPINLIGIIAPITLIFITAVIFIVRRKK